MKMKQCAFLSMDSLHQFEAYDHLLREPLKQYGWSVEDVPWRETGRNWNDFEVVVIRSPWDYQDDPRRFLQVLEAIERSGARLFNPLELVHWNIDKIYLCELEQQGLPIVPTEWSADRGEINEAVLKGLFDTFDSGEIVIKPTVSANADDTYRLTPDAAAAMLPELVRVFHERAWMAQPFMANIPAEGEYSLIYFGEEYSHSLLKTPEKNDFRVQEEHGGVLKSIDPEPDLLRVANRIMASVDPLPLYARVDMVRGTAGFLLMELELIEPSLYFNMDPESPGRFAHVFNEWVG